MKATLKAGLPKSNAQTPTPDNPRHGDRPTHGPDSAQGTPQQPPAAPQTLPNIPRGTKVSPVENHCCQIHELLTLYSKNSQPDYPSLTTLNGKGISRHGIRSICNSTLLVLKNQKTLVKAATISAGHPQGLHRRRGLNT